MTAVNDMWVWIDERVIRAVHEEQLSEHGGALGLRHAGLLQSAVARHRQLAAYGGPDTAALAAAYGYGLARNHPFVDGNKRTAFVATELFLRLNGYAPSAKDADCVLTMLAVAAGDTSEAAFADWFAGAPLRADSDRRHTPRARSALKRCLNAANVPSSSACRTSRIKSR